MKRLQTDRQTKYQTDIVTSLAFFTAEIESVKKCKQTTSKR